MAQPSHDPSTLTASFESHPASPEADASRRDFLGMTTVTVGAAGVGAAGWLAVNSMNPAADTLALASIELDLASIPVGEARTVMWRGKPVFVRHRTPEEIAKAEADDAANLPDPAKDDARITDAKGVQHKQWLIVVGVCTHLGCVPQGSKVGDARGDYGGWFCPCHGSHYDTSGRIRQGPAPSNLAVPEYTFLTDTKVKIG